MRLSGSERKQLHAALLDAFPDRGMLARMVDFALDQNLNSICGGDNLSDVVYRLILWAEARGRLEELISKARDDSPQNLVLRDCVVGLLERCPEPFSPGLRPAEPVGSAETTPWLGRTQVDSVNQGFEALSQLLENPRIRPKLFAFRDYFQSTRKQIVLLRDYKELHDELHHLQRGCYEQIKSAIGRFQEDSEAGENLKDYRLTLNEFTERIKLIALRKSEAAAEAARIQTALANACQKLEKGLEGSDQPGLSEAVRILSRMLSMRPPLIDNSLHSTTLAMHLPELVGALQVVCDEMANLHLDAEKVQKFSLGVDALAQLNGSLKAMISVHHQWQDVDIELRRIEFSIEFSLEHGFNELGESWPELKERAAPLSEGNPDGWGADFRKVGAELDGALALHDPARVNRPFQRYRRMAAERFFAIDKTLKERCSELCSIAEPIDLVLEMIQ